MKFFFEPHQIFWQKVTFKNSKKRSYPRIHFIGRYEWIFLGEFIKVFIPLCSRPDKRDKHFVHDTNTTMNTSWNKLGDMYITDIITEWHTFSFTMLFFERIHNKIFQIVGIFHFWNKICTFLTCYWMFLQIRYIETIIVPIKTNSCVKFSFSEKATKIWSYHPLDLRFTK